MSQARHFSTTLYRALKKHSQVVCGFGMGLMFAASYVPQGMMAHSLRKWYQLYENGLPVDLDKYTTNLKEEVLEKVYLKPEAEVDVLVIPTACPDPIHKGSTRLKGGTLIGLPANFSYRKLEDVDKSRLLAGGNTLDWAKDATKQLANSLVLNDLAKKFVIAREIGYASTWQVFNRPMLACLGFSVAYCIGFTLNELYGLKRRFPTRVRVLLYSIWGAVGTGLYVLCLDSYMCHLDRKSDKYAARQGPEYAQGGVEYYQKLLDRNRALRELIPDGSKYYTLYGNQVATWRQKSVSLTERLDALKKELDKYGDESLVEKKKDSEEECVHCKS